MATEVRDDERHLFTRREIMVGALQTALVASTLPALAREASAASEPYRAINIVNFIRAEEPREPMDLMLPVREQMAAIKAHNFPATWLLQYDALVEGPFVDFLKKEMLPSHEVGIWFEMNRKICDDAGIAWRGNPDWEWDYHVPVAYSIGYTPEERRKLADTAAATFKRIFGKDLKSVASWNLDAVSVAHFADHHGIDAFANCRDQLATDGFTIWGAPIAAYYPNRLNAWSPATEAKNQISTPIFRLLGQDPVYYYDNTLSYPDTMEPVWPSGQSEVFVDRFFEMIARSPTQAFGYAQLGQENSFGWPMMGKAFVMQMEKLARLPSAPGLVIETMGETGRRFKRTFKSTPTQAQIMLEDPFGPVDHSRQQRDVTAAVQALVKDNTLLVTAGNDLAGGDPANNTHKLLRVDYTLNGTAHTRTAHEEEQIHIPGPGEASGELRITHAVYGVLDKAPERTVWYQSKYHRANLHFRGTEFYLRDLHVYNDQFPQPFLTDTVKQHGIEQRLLAVLDGFHWSDDNVRSGRPGRRSMGRFALIGDDGKETTLTMAGLPSVTGKGSTLQTIVPLASGGTFTMLCHEKDIEFSVSGTPSHAKLGLLFEWTPDRSALQTVSADTLHYRFRDFDYALRIGNGVATKTDDGARIVASGRGSLRLLLEQVG